jgi:hypothetical protein
MRRNLWPSLPDAFTIPAGVGNGNASDSAVEVYRKHCFPTVEESAAKIRSAREEYKARHPSKPLDVLYILTNADAAWVEGFAARMKQEGWGTVVGSPNLVLDIEQKELGMAIDMEMGRRAEVFIGNGVCPVHPKLLLRSADDVSLVVIIHEQHHTYSFGRQTSGIS